MEEYNRSKGYTGCGMPLLSSSTKAHEQQLQQQFQHPFPAKVRTVKERKMALKMYAEIHQPTYDECQ